MMRRILEFDFAIGPKGEHISIMRREGRDLMYALRTPRGEEILMSEKEFGAWVKGLNVLVEEK